MALAWLWPSDGTASLVFTRADVQFLFPAPITRRQLIRYKIVRMQLGALLSTAIITVFFRPGSLAAGWTFFVGVSLATSILIVHLTAVSLSRASIRQHGRSGLARQWLPLLLLGGISAVVVNLMRRVDRVSAPQPQSSILRRAREELERAIRAARALDIKG